MSFGGACNGNVSGQAESAMRGVQVSVYTVRGIGVLWHPHTLPTPHTIPIPRTQRSHISSTTPHASAHPREPVSYMWRRRQRTQVRETDMGCEGLWFF